MSNSRQAILGRLKSAVGREATAQVQPQTPVRQNLSKRLRPDISGDNIERFILLAQASGTSVTRVRNRSEISTAVLSFLNEHELDLNIVVSADPVLEGLAWPDELEVDCRAAIDEDKTSVTGAVAAVAETGSVVVQSGPTAPNSLAFLPDNHLSVVLGDQLVPHLDDVLAMFGNADMPRALSFITGPSKTADVEQTLQHGAHGPKRKHIILVDNAGSE